MSSIDVAIAARAEIDAIIDTGAKTGGLSLAQVASLQRLLGLIGETREVVSKVAKHNAFCSYYGGPHDGPCNPSSRGVVSYEDGSVRGSEQASEPNGTECAGLVPDARYFPSGSYRDGQEGKLDYEGFLSPSALFRYGQYMDKNRLQSDGQMRDTDNWQKGIPVDAYMKSMWRHLVAAWTEHRHGTEDYDQDALEDALCGVVFNAFGYLHELMERG